MNKVVTMQVDAYNVDMRPAPMPIRSPDLFYEYNGVSNWASSCCGMRIDDATSPYVKPEDSWIGVRVYLGAHLESAGEQNVVRNLSTKSGDISMVFTQTVLTCNTRELGINDPGCKDDADGFYDEEEEE